METTQTTTTYNESESTGIGPVVFQALMGVVVIGTHVIKQWQAWGQGTRFFALAFLFVLVLAPCIQLVRHWLGKDVNFKVLASSGYTLVWMAFVLLEQHAI